MEWWSTLSESFGSSADIKCLFLSLGGSNPLYRGYAFLSCKENEEETGLPNQSAWFLVH
jgi:hypothetical protein